MSKTAERLGSRLDIADRFDRLVKASNSPEVVKLPEASSPEPGQLYRAADLAALFRVRTATIWKWAKTGVLPEPVKIGHGHYIAWKASVILGEHAHNTAHTQQLFPRVEITRRDLSNLLAKQEESLIRS
jgi:predicted DNA-binding transcriptional regulator AlpA